MVADLHPFAQHGLAFDGVELVRADLSVVLQLTHGFFEQWQVRGDDTIVPQIHGQLRRNRKRNILSIGLAGFVRGVATTEATDRTALEELLIDLRDLFDPAADAATLTLTLTDGTQYTIDARAVSDPIDIGPATIPSYRDFSVELFSISPLGWVQVVGS